jgi:hypothetical protein
MKTLKVFALLSLVLAFTAKVNAQTVVTRDIQFPSNFFIDCVNEPATGTVTMQLKQHFNKDGILIRYQQEVTGEFTGLSGTVYTLKGIWQDNNHIAFTNGAYTDNSQIIYRLVGQSGIYKDLNFKFHGLWKMTVTPNGDFIVVMWKPFFECD